MATSVGFVAVASAGIAAELDVWTDGSLVEDKVSGASSAGAGCSTYRCSRLWANWRWAIWMKMLGRMQLLVLVVVLSCSWYTAVCSVG